MLEDQLEIATCVARSKAKSCSWALLTGAAPCWSHMHQGALLILCPCHSPQGDSVGEVSVLLQPTQGWRHEWARCLGIALNHLSCIVTKSYIFLSLPSPILSSLQILFSPNFSHHFFLPTPPDFCFSPSILPHSPLEHRYWALWTAPAPVSLNMITITNITTPGCYNNILNRQNSTKSIRASPTWEECSRELCVVQWCQKLWGHHLHMPRCRN